MEKLALTILVVFAFVMFLTTSNKNSNKNNNKLRSDKALSGRTARQIEHRSPDKVIFVNPITFKSDTNTVFASDVDGTLGTNPVNLNLTPGYHHIKHNGQESVILVLQPMHTLYDVQIFMVRMFKVLPRLDIVLYKGHEGTYVELRDQSDAYLTSQPGSTEIVWKSRNQHVQLINTLFLLREPSSMLPATHVTGTHKKFYLITPVWSNTLRLTFTPNNSFGLRPDIMFDNDADQLFQF